MQSKATLKQRGTGWLFTTMRRIVSRRVLLVLFFLRSPSPFSSLFLFFSIYARNFISRNFEQRNVIVFALRKRELFGQFTVVSTLCANKKETASCEGMDGVWYLSTPAAGMMEGYSWKLLKKRLARVNWMLCVRGFLINDDTRMKR